jgi:hypothetical protein
MRGVVRREVTSGRNWGTCPGDFQGTMASLTGLVQQAPPEPNGDVRNSPRWAFDAIELRVEFAQCRCERGGLPEHIPN